MKRFFTFEAEYEPLDSMRYKLEEETNTIDVKKNAAVLVECALREVMEQDELEKLIDSCKEIARTACLVMPSVKCTYSDIMCMYKTIKDIRFAAYVEGAHEGMEKMHAGYMASLKDARIDAHMEMLSEILSED